MPNENEILDGKDYFERSNSVTSSDYFKRVILAVRLKGQDRLYLKAFRDIPLQNLPQLLPIGKLQIGHFEQRLIRSTFFRWYWYSCYTFNNNNGEFSHYQV